MDTTLKMLNLYVAGRLPMPRDTTVVLVPIKATVYNDNQIVSWPRRDYRITTYRSGDFQEESITIRKYLVDGQVIYAGYGPQTKTLVIGIQGDPARYSRDSLTPHMFAKRRREIE